MTFTRLYYNLYINHGIYTAEGLPITGGVKVLKVGGKIARGACENFFLDPSTSSLPGVMKLNTVVLQLLQCNAAAIFICCHYHSIDELSAVA
jgi:hypothetical protein